MNKAIISGFCAATPELIERGNGKYVANFVVYSDDYPHRQEIHRCALYDARAESLPEQLGKGSYLTVEGRMKTTRIKKHGHVFHYTTIVVQKYSIPPSHNFSVLAKLVEDIYGPATTPRLPEASKDGVV